MDVATLLALVAGVIGALGSAYTIVAQARAKIKADQRQQQMTEHEKLIDRQEKQINRLEHQNEDLHKGLEKLQKDGANCREKNAEFYGWMRIFRDGWVREVRRLGGSTDDIPELPEREDLQCDNSRGEFIKRTAEQNQVLIGELDPKKEGQP